MTAPMQGRRDFGRKLQEQLNNIKRAAEDYDRGCVETAPQIAVALRIVFHDKGRNNTSLFTHLGSPSIALLSTAPEPSGVSNAPSGLLTQVELMPTELRLEYKPLLGEARDRRMVSVDEWWTKDYVYKDTDDSVTINRRDLALAVTEQDGGAHVDHELRPVYQRIVNGAGWGMNVDPPNGSSIVVEVTNAHLAPLRQMAWELHRSPDLHRLAREGK